MTKAIDPFEEYLRKKKVELLEKKYRDPADEAAPSAERPGGIPPDEDPEIDARLREEAKDFLQSGQSAAVQAYQSARDISEEKVEDIKDATSIGLTRESPAP
jgi:hypothetical protein